MASGFDLVPLTPQKTDPAWKHCQMFKNENRVHLKCIYCNKVLKGGGIHRIKEHLAGHKGNASTCLQVPEAVRLLMQQSLDGAVTRRRKKQKIDQVIATIEHPSNSNEVDALVTQEGGSGAGITANIELLPIDFDSSEHHQTPVVSHGGRIDKNKVRRKRTREKASSDLALINGDQNVSSRKVNSDMDIAIGRFLYDIGAPMSAVNSIYFKPMIDAVASSGSGVVGPSYHDMRGQVLKKVVDELKNDIAKYASTWERTGCSLIVEQWNTDKDRVFLGFLVYCPEGKVSLKSVDATEFIHAPAILLQVLMEVLGEVGVKNVLQVITNDEKHFVDAGKRLMDMYPNLYWSPCSAQCIDLILKDFGEIDWIRSIIEQAQSITRFVYNHASVLNLLRKYTSGVDIVEPGRSCFATNFITLRRMVEHANNLKSMFTSQEWKYSPYSENSEGSEIVQFVQSEEFWSSCARITRLTSPLLRLLSIVASERKAAIGYVYAGMYRVREAIKKELSGEMDYKEYWRIIDQRWRCHGSQPLHAAGFHLNPKFFYSIKGDLPGEIVSGMLDCIERLVKDPDVQVMISRELNFYKNASGDFGRKMAVRAKDIMLPADWWQTYGGGCPNLKRLAIRILGQTCSLDVPKSHKPSFDQLHDAGNSLEHQRLSDLIFVQHNFGLRANKNQEELSDPIASEVVEDWVVRKKKKDTATTQISDEVDWFAVDPHYLVRRGGPPVVDETEELGTGFDDDEIMNPEKVREADNVEDHNNNNSDNNAEKE